MPPHSNIQPIGTVPKTKQAQASNFSVHDDSDFLEPSHLPIGKGFLSFLYKITSGKNEERENSFLDRLNLFLKMDQDHGLGFFTQSFQVTEEDIRRK